MFFKMDLVNMPFDKFKKLIENYSEWIQETEKTVFMYIEANRIPMDQAEEIVKIAQQKSVIDIDLAQKLLDECTCSKEVKEKIRKLYQTDAEEEKEWIVYYNHMDVGHRVRAKKYTDALLAAYVKYGSDGKITKVEEVKSH